MPTIFENNRAKWEAEYVAAMDAWTTERRTKAALHFMDVAVPQMFAQIDDDTKTIERRSHSAICEALTRLIAAAQEQMRLYGAGVDLVAETAIAQRSLAIAEGRA